MKYKPGDIILVPTISEYICMFVNDEFAVFRMLSGKYDSVFGYVGRVYKQNHPKSPKVIRNESPIV